jgi:hypothetical protein
MSGLFTFVTGELLAGVRTQYEPWSTPLTHIAWKVACAAAEASIEVKTAAENSIVYGRFSVAREVEKNRRELHAGPRLLYCEHIKHASHI